MLPALCWYHYRHGLDLPSWLMSAGVSLHVEVANVTRQDAAVSGVLQALQAEATSTRLTWVDMAVMLTEYYGGSGVKSSQLALIHI